MVDRTLDSKVRQIYVWTLVSSTWLWKNHLIFQVCLPFWKNGNSDSIYLKGLLWVSWTQFFLWIVSFFFWTLMHHTPLSSCHSVFKSYNVILLFCSILTRLASFVPSWEGESALTSLNHCAPGGFSSYSYCHAFISWHSDFMSVLCSWLMGIVFGRWIYWSSAVPLSLWALKAQG